MQPNGAFLEYNHIVNGLVPLADRFAGTVVTDWINMEGYERCTFIVHTGNSTGGASDGVMTIVAADDNTGTNPVTTPFYYSASASSTTVDTWSAPVLTAATGQAMVGTDNYIYAFEVTAAQVLAAGRGDTPAHNATHVKLSHAEDTDDPIVASVLVILSNPKNATNVPRTAID